MIPAYDTHVVILAAGKGTRMRSSLPKVMHPVAGLPMVAHVVRAAVALRAGHIVTVVAPDMETVRSEVLRHAPEAAFCEQATQEGTGHAVLQTEPLLREAPGVTLIVFGDGPLLRPETMRALADRVMETDNTALAVLGMDLADPSEYGRLICDTSEGLERIVEYRDATQEERKVTLCNSGVMAVKNEHLFALLKAVGNENARGEYYLTDIVRLARERSLRCAVSIASDPDELKGVNSRAQLAEAEAALQRRLRERAMVAGVTLVAPETVFLSVDTDLGQDTVVQPFVTFGSGVRVGCGVEIRAFSHLEGADVADGAVIGPYARLRPGARIGKQARIGNFVEVKQAAFAEGAKANHLSYIGDADVGAGANIGAGTITCNYDGFHKHHTTIGPEALIGSNAALVAPVTIGRAAIVGAGSVVTGDVPDEALAIARADQKTIPAKARQIRERKQA